MRIVETTRAWLAACAVLAAAGGLGAAQEPPRKAPTEGLVGHWKLEETGGAEAADSPGIAFAPKPFFAQDAKKKPGPPKGDPMKVDAAVRSGTAFLKTYVANIMFNPDEKANDREGRYGDELVLWTLVHAGVPEADPTFQRLFQSMMSSKLKRTYNVALQAMILEAMDRVKYQPRLQECAQFLVDNQCKNGEWAYGEPTAFVPDVSTGQPRKDVATPGKSKPYNPLGPINDRVKPKVVRHVAVKKTREIPLQGDHSNAQYAALGLRACFNAGIDFPEEVIRKAQKHWRETQITSANAPKNIVEPAGWAYAPGVPYPKGSMTAGAIGSLAICDYILGEPWMKDKALLSGIEWLAQNFSVTKNPEFDQGVPPTSHLGYYLYALERAGILYGTETFGAHEWYPDGANFLLKAQKPDGSWAITNGANVIAIAWDTCFAILFLRRATRPLQDIATEDRFIPGK